MMKKFLLTVIALVTGVCAYAQQDVLVTQYMFNPLLVNPAYAGSKDYAMASALYRNQWAGLQGAPKTMLVSLHGPVFKSRKVGLGLTIVNDKIGIINRTSVFGDYAYHITLNDNGLKLGMGLKGGIYYQSDDLAAAKIVEQDDKVYQGGTQKRITPEATAGLFLRNEKFYVGLSVTNLISYNSDRPVSIDGSNSKLFPYVRHYWLSGGYVIHASENVVVRPSIMFRYTKNAPLQADINCNVLLKQILWLGATMRTGESHSGIAESVTGIIELQITKQMRVGYSYDFTMTKLNNYTHGSHEITLGYDFGYDITMLKSPRYF